MNRNQRFAAFFAGRNGVDNLGRFVLWIGIISMIVTMFAGNIIVYLIGLISIIYSYFRMMSRNVQKRYQENQKYLSITRGIRPAFDRFSRFWTELPYKIRARRTERQRQKQYKFFTCPGCKQKLRVPRGKGKLEITCPKCGMKMFKRS